MRAIAGAALVATLLATGCSPAVSPSAAPATTTAPSAGKPSPSASASGSGTATPSALSASAALTRDEGWRADIDAVLESRERLHPDPWHDMPRAAWGHRPELRAAPPLAVPRRRPARRVLRRRVARRRQPGAARPRGSRGRDGDDRALGRQRRRRPGRHLDGSAPRLARRRSGWPRRWRCSPRHW